MTVTKFVKIYEGDRFKKKKKKKTFKVAHNSFQYFLRRRF